MDARNPTWVELQKELGRIQGLMEREYRRGYIDGWAECIQAIEKSTFMFKYFDKLLELLDQHYFRDLRRRYRRLH